ncbi:hypothetical protein TrRE_jg3533 [Triparma retinervis]|uniref:Uncharacterized protein n=1 Tax=Triparma retinervis TaxID=2557542 RepID=A0A9W7FZ06_9STRA|nr:hypothetical protein TrRE_jg3533 [Triparma retinervis]
MILDELRSKEGFGDILLISEFDSGLMRTLSRHPRSVVFTTLKEYGESKKANRKFANPSAYITAILKRVSKEQAGGTGEGTRRLKVRRTTSATGRASWPDANE